MLVQVDDNDVGEAEEVRLCATCLRYRPIEHFRRYHRDRPKRHSECRECRREADADRRAVKQRKTTIKALSAIKRSKSARQLDFVIAQVVHSLGGVEEFAVQVRALFDETKDSKKYFSAMRILLVLMQAQKQYELAQPQIDYSTLTDEELECVLHDGIRAVYGTDFEIEFVD